MKLQVSAEDRISIQTSQYAFPYHWLPNMNELGVVAGRSMQWALEYFGYMTTIANEIKEAQAESVIDIGCGDGRLGSLLNDQLNLDYLGIDIAVDAIEFAKILNPIGRYRCAQPSSVCERFDVAVLVEVLEHIPDESLSKFLFNVRDVLKSDGLLILSVPTTVRKVHPKHFRHYDETLLTDQLHEVGFYTIKMCRIHRANLLARLLQIALSNRLFTLNPSLLTKFIWSAYKRFCLVAHSSDGAHLIAIAKIQSLTEYKCEPLTEIVSEKENILNGK